MRSEVVVSFSPTQQFTIPVNPGDAMDSQAARRWLDEQFVANECSPLRASGKVLTADKVLALAQTVGPARFADDPAFAHGYAHAAAAALGRPTVVVDAEEGAVTF